MLLPLRESRAPEFSLNTSFTIEFLTWLACFNNTVNSSELSVGFSNCLLILAKIDFASSTLVSLFSFPSIVVR